MAYNRFGVCAVGGKAMNIVKADGFRSSGRMVNEDYDMMRVVVDMTKSEYMRFANGGFGYPLLDERFLKSLAKKTIKNCKKRCYGWEAGNVSEGDYGTWKQWENVLVKYGKEILKNFV